MRAFNVDEIDTMSFNNHPMSATATKFQPKEKILWHEYPLINEHQWTQGSEGRRSRQVDCT